MHPRFARVPRFGTPKRVRVAPLTFEPETVVPAQEAFRLAIPPAPTILALPTFFTLIPHGAHDLAKTEAIEMEAIVTQALPNAMFKIRLDGTDREILGFVSGKMRKHFIRILPGDRVKVELSPYDLTRARIVFRQK